MVTPGFPQRNSKNGLINLPHSAVKMANNARSMIMAAGSNPITGGIDQYPYVYRINITNNPYTISFANHNRYNGGQRGRMHVQDFIVEALKGERGTYIRHAFGEAFGVSRSSSYPSGDGFHDKKTKHTGFYKGPFFPSVHSGSGSSSGSCSSCTRTNYEPDSLSTQITVGTKQQVMVTQDKRLFGLNKSPILRQALLNFYFKL